MVFIFNCYVDRVHITLPKCLINRRLKVTHVAYLQLHLDLSGFSSSQNLNVTGYLKDKEKDVTQI